MLSLILICVKKGAPQGSRTMIPSSEEHSLIEKYNPWNIEKQLIRTMAICLALWATLPQVCGKFILVALHWINLGGGIVAMNSEAKLVKESNCCILIYWTKLSLKVRNSKTCSLGLKIIHVLVGPPRHSLNNKRHKYNCYRLDFVHEIYYIPI